jgi:alpha-galactosidase
MSLEKTPICSAPADTVIACRVSRDISLDAGHPAAEWQAATPVVFCQDWRGANADPTRRTEVRVLWTLATLYLRFACRYRELFVFEDSDPSGRRDQLWDRDVAEAFLQPDPARPRYYKEFEVGPNGMWIDLDIFPEGRRDLGSGLRHSASIDREKNVWAAELAIPMRGLTPEFDPTAVWRANFYRVEGPREPRFYSAWRATNTPQPNFHVPAAFGKLRFAEPC